MFNQKNDLDWIKENIWISPDAVSFLWVVYDDAWIFFDKRSGCSHIFNDFSRGIFSYFEEKPTGFLDLLKAIKKDMGNDFSNDLEDKILETIQIFDQKGIISPL